jgi:hypothetical protein
MDRQKRFQFKGGRNSPSEYEGALAFFLCRDGWNQQQIMDAIAVWRRKHDLPAPKYHSRYRTTIAKAAAMVTDGSMVVKEPTGAWKHGEPKAGLLDALPDAPPDGVCLDAAAVRMALSRLAGQALREYPGVPAAEGTPAPAAVPAYDPYEDPSGKVTAYDPYDDPFAVPNNWTWLPDGLDDFAEEEAEQVLPRAGGVTEFCSSDSSTGHCGSQF